MSFKPKIDQHYASPVFGIMKFVGYKPGGAFIFDRYEKSFAASGPNQGWYVKDQMLADPVKFRELEAIPIPPPQ